MRYFIIMNPASRGGKSQKQFDLIHRLLKNNGIAYDFEYTKSIDHAYELSKNANMSGYNVIAAVGGDGTINRVLNGFYNIDGSRNSKAKFGVIYTGTSPDFCKSYNIPLDINHAVNALVKGATRQIGIGRIEFFKDVKYFTCCANIGLGATLANNANSGIRKILGDKIGTFMALLKTLATYKPIDVSVNGKIFNKVYNISVGKTFYIASGIKIKNELTETDGRFYILTVQKHIPRFIWNLYKGKPLPLEYAKEISIEGAGKVEFDGDEGGNLPCKITSAKNLEVIYEANYE